MKLTCSRGCVIDTGHPFHQFLPGEKCQCGRILNPICDECGKTIKKNVRGGVLKVNIITIKAEIKRYVSAVTIKQYIKRAQHAMAQGK